MGHPTEAETPHSVGLFYTQRMALAVAWLCVLAGCSASSGSDDKGRACDTGECDGDGGNSSGRGSSAGCDVAFPSDEGPIREYFDRFRMPVERNGCTTLHRPHSVRRWNVFYTGRCAGCRIPSRISSAAFDDTLIVSWVASAAYGDSEEPNKRRFGHLSTFTFDQESGFNQVNDFVFEECDYDMGSVAVSPDGSVIGALCISHRPDHDHQKNVTLYEWTGGTITQTPDVKTVVSSAAGGWNYGHWDLSLNNSLSHYYMSLKTVTNDGGHQGMTRFALNRQSLEKEPRPGGCGAHPNSNRIAHNKHDDTWSVFCRAAQKTIHWAFVDPPDFRGSVTDLGSWVETSLSDTPGGLHNGISLGRDGWLVAATGPFDLWEGVDGSERKAELREQQIGLRKLPGTMEEFQQNESAYPWRWIPLEDICEPTKGGDRLAGMVQLHHWGLGGEESGRILMAYSPTRSHTRSTEFHVVEVDTEGNLLHDPVVLQKGGWGIDTLGTYMPGSGCVVFPLTWVPDAPEEGAGGAYPTFEESVTKRSEFLKFTAVCPASCSSPKSSGACTTQPSLFTEAEPRAPGEYEAECPAF